MQIWASSNIKQNQSLFSLRCGMEDAWQLDATYSFVFDAVFL